MTARGFVRPNDPLKYPQGPSWVYRHLDANGATIYIGTTCQPEQRQSAHRRASAWFPLVAEIVYHEPMQPHEAAELERKLIGEEEPPFNIQGTRRGRKPLPPERTQPVRAWLAEQDAQQQASA